jgi:mono/diheme cytochrome c family protein
MKALRMIMMAELAIAWAATMTHAQSGPRSGPQLQRGHDVALSQCSACHVVARDQESPPLLRNPAPSFQSIAARPETTEKSLRHFIASTHWDLKTVPITMPNPELSAADATAVVRYILSLKLP